MAGPVRRRAIGFILTLAALALTVSARPGQAEVFNPTRYVLNNGLSWW